MLTLLTNSTHIKFFKKNLESPPPSPSPSPVQRLAIGDPPSSVGFGSGLTLVLHGKL